MFMSEQIEKLIVKALQGNILPEEHDKLERWLGEDEVHQKLFDEFAFVWKQTANGSKPDDSNTEAEWDQLTEKIGMTPATEKRRYLVWALPIAAAIALVWMVLSFDTK